MNEVSDEILSESTQQLQQEFQSLSLHAMDSTLISGTLRFTGYINGHVVQVLLDGGSDDNFLQPRVANFLQLPILPIPSFKVLVGNGNALQVEGLIIGLQVIIQKTVLNVDVYLLPVMGADLILGTSWLATLGPHITDYNKLFIQFVLQDQLITLQGDRSLKPQMTSIHQLHRLYSTKAIDSCYTLSISDVDQQDHPRTNLSNPQNSQNSAQLHFSVELPEDLQQVLFKYHTVFAIPMGLPP